MPEPAERLRYSNIREHPPSRGNPTITKLNSVRDNFYLTETARVFPAIKKNQTIKNPANRYPAPGIPGGLQ
jgi:hypothetical protein